MIQRETCSKIVYPTLGISYKRVCNCHCENEWDLPRPRPLGKPHNRLSEVSWKRPLQKFGGRQFCIWSSWIWRGLRICFIILHSWCRVSCKKYCTVDVIEVGGYLCAIEIFLHKRLPRLRLNLVVVASLLNYRRTRRHVTTPFIVSLRWVETVEQLYIVPLNQFRYLW